MGPSLTLLLLGCFQFVQQHRLCGRHPWSRRSAPRGKKSSRRQNPAFGHHGLAQFDGTLSEGMGAEGDMWVFIFYHVQKSRENPSVERVGNKEVERGAEKREG